jgi:asparagine synthase (glutamine-hydrolysing)
MCGIAGYWGRFNSELIDQIGKRLAHRGPDDAGVYAEPNAGIALVHRRLSIIDISAAGHQPMADTHERIVTVYNGEIYNYRELRAQLANEGVQFRSSSDTEVLLALYLKHGTALLPMLNGIFAFVVWDRERRDLFLARDALGVKPLYFSASTRGFAFASELKALILALEQRTLDPTSLHRYLSFLWCPGEGTPLREVRQLAPGEAMVVRDGRIARRWTWYELPARRPRSAPLPDDETVPSTVRLLRQAVHRQLVADVPVGAFLSGGLDSSAVVAFARERAQDLRCFTIELVGGNDPGFVDDLPYAKQVAAHLGVRLDVVRVDSSRMARDLERMVWGLDEPLADPAPLNVYYISQLARDNGIKVLLSGAGGDDLFTGYRRHLALRYERLWSWLPSKLRTALGIAAGRMDASTAFGRRAQRLFVGALNDGPARLASYFVWAPESRLRALYSPAFAAELGDQRADQPLIDYLAGISQGFSPLEQMLALEQRFFLADHNLAYTDRMSMLAGVEVRVPFLDVDLVEHAARIPDRFKQHGRTSKWVLKKAMEPYLPHDVIYRPKTGFGAPLRRWLRNELKPLLAEVLSLERLKRRGLFNPVAVQQLISANQRGSVDAAYTLLSLVSIEAWCAAFLDGGAVGAANS